MSKEKDGYNGQGIAWWQKRSWWRKYWWTVIIAVATVLGSAYTTVNTFENYGEDLKKVQEEIKIIEEIQDTLIVYRGQLNTIAEDIEDIEESVSDIAKHLRGDGE